ncbi:MAG TPA: hypothetical protein VIG82_02850 [Enteractinococcus sp.]
MLWSTGTGSFVGFSHTHLAVCLTNTYANHVAAVATQLHRFTQQVMPLWV